MQEYAEQWTPAGSSCGIAVMAKASAAGRTKTRLVPPLTFDEAAEFNTAFLKDVAHNIARAAELQSIDGYMAFGPPGRMRSLRRSCRPPSAFLSAGIRISAIASSMPLRSFWAGGTPARSC